MHRGAERDALVISTSTGARLAVVSDGGGAYFSNNDVASWDGDRQRVLWTAPTKPGGDDAEGEPAEGGDAPQGGEVEAGSFEDSPQEAAPEADSGETQAPGDGPEAAAGDSDETASKAAQAGAEG